MKPVPASMEERLRDQREQQRLWRLDEPNRIHSDRNNASRAQRREDDQELFVDYAFLGKYYFYTYLGFVKNLFIYVKSKFIFLNG